MVFKDYRFRLDLLFQRPNRGLLNKLGARKIHRPNQQQCQHSSADKNQPKLDWLDFKVSAGRHSD